MISLEFVFSFQIDFLMQFYFSKSKKHFELFSPSYTHLTLELIIDPSSFSLSITINISFTLSISASFSICSVLSLSNICSLFPFLSHSPDSSFSFFSVVVWSTVLSSFLFHI